MTRTHKTKSTGSSRKQKIEKVQKGRKGVKIAKKASPDASSDEKKRKRRYRPGTVALREIGRYQKSTKLLMSKGPLRRLVRSISEKYSSKGVRFTGKSFVAIQEAVEDRLLGTLRLANDICTYSGRMTMSANDVMLAHKIRKGEVV